jgi:Ca-activated chloride channel family protein
MNHEIVAVSVQKMPRNDVETCVTSDGRVGSNGLAMSRVAQLAPLVFLFFTLVPGQSAENADEHEFKLTAQAELVLLNVSVKDTKGGFVSNLKKENFQVYENGKLQIISQFGKEDTPITAGLVLDDSRSMRPKRGEVINAALAFIDASNPLDEMFVTHFNDRVRHGLPPGTTFSGDPELLRKALWNNPAEGRTAMYDGILDAMHQLERGRQEKKSLVVISDGGDNASVHQFKDVLSAVQTSPATIYTVGIFDSEDPDRNPRLLHHIASISGGICYIPQHLEELESICRGIAKDIRNRYSVGYVPVRVNDKSALRSIRVAITDAGNQRFIVHARTSYLLPARP